MKKSKEVCELTGLSRKLLFDYDEQGIVKATSHEFNDYEDRNGKSYEGYKLYDDNAVRKLQQVSIFRKLKIKRSDIKKIMTAPDYDYNRVLDMQIDMLNQEIEELKKLLNVAKSLKYIGPGDEILRIYSNIDFMELAEKTEFWNDSMASQVLDLKLSNITDEFIQRVDDRIRTINKALFDKTDENIVTYLVKELYEMCRAEYGISGICFIYIIVFCILGEGEVSVSINECFSNNISYDLANAIMEYLQKEMDVFIEDFTEILVQNYDIVGKDFCDRHVLEIVAELKKIISFKLGVNESSEYELFFTFIKMTKYFDEDTLLGYALRALQYHCIEKEV